MDKNTLSRVLVDASELDVIIKFADKLIMRADQSLTDALVSIKLDAWLAKMNINKALSTAIKEI
jgi:hypothetical protein